MTITETPTQEASRLNYEEIEPDLQDNQRECLCWIVKYLERFGSWPDYKQLHHFMMNNGYKSISPITISSRCTELRKLQLVIPVENPKGKKIGSLNKLSRMALRLTRHC